MTDMKRRDLVGFGLGSLALGGLQGCAREEGTSSEPAGTAAGSQKTYEWRMVTTWPKNFPGLGTGAEKLASLIDEMSGGRLRVKVFGAGELVPAMEAFDAVSRGAAEMGHGASYYWKGKTAAAQFFSAVPFGLTAQEMNGWLYHGGGMALWEEVYAPFDLVPAAAGNTGVQMAGWFNTAIERIEDLKGLKMRIPGLGGEVLKRAGGVPVTLPGGEIFTSLQSGVIDATEFVGPYNDLAFGLHKAATYYYYPGWHEPGTTLEAFIHRPALEALPTDLQSIVRNACRVANQDMLAEYTARNNEALDTLIETHGVNLRRLPEPVLDRLRRIADEVVAELAEADPLTRRVHDSFHSFREKVQAWHARSERAYLNTRPSV